MPSPRFTGLRNHLHVLVIVPLVIIVMTWPTFANIFDPDEFWIHARQTDEWIRIWDAWHLEQVLAGHADLYYTDVIFHPPGLSLAFQAFVFPHAFLLIALKTILPVDDAYSLLFLLILCFNSFCGYVLIRHLVKDKWISLFGAVVFVVNTPYPFGSTAPDHIMMGTLPLAIYFFHRFLAESKSLFALLAGLCAGVTAFISVYVFAFILLSLAVLLVLKSLSEWSKPGFWRGLLIFVLIWGSVSLLRFYPMLVDRAHLDLAMDAYQDVSRSNDMLEHFVLPNNPFTGALFGEPLDARDDYEHSFFRKEYKEAYLGYINLVLMACAFLLLPQRRKLLPWTVIMVCFAVLRLGSYLTFNGAGYPGIVLSEGLLRAWFPFIFRNIGNQEYYQMGVVTPLAVLSCFGLAGVLRSIPAKARIPVLMLCIVIVCFETYIPRLGQTIERNKTDFIVWLRSESDSPIKLVNLPLADKSSSYFLYVQSLAGYPQAYGVSTRLKPSARRYIVSNLLLRNWADNRSVHCLPHNEPAFTSALEQLLADGFSHIIVHNWLYGDQFIIRTFESVPTAYNNGYVSVYRVSDLHLSCQNQGAELPRFIQFAQSSSAIPGRQSSILSFHPSQAIDPDRFDFLGSLFADWRSLVHLYLDNGELVIESSDERYKVLDAFLRDSQIIHFLYNTRDADPDMLNAHDVFDGFNLCQLDVNDDGAVIEHYVTRKFSCALINSSAPLSVQYDNGARLENLLIEVSQDQLDLQLRWSNLPDEAYSLSIQVIDAAGERVIGQDSVIGPVSLARHRIDISSLPPGSYVAKLIVYNFQTGHTVDGTVNADDARFNRALEIATINRS